MRKNSFTLVELLIVIIIIGILATMAVPQYNKMVLKSKLDSQLQVLSGLKSAMLVYYAQYSLYANSISELDIQLPSKNDTNSPFAYWVWEGGGNPVNWATNVLDQPTVGAFMKIKTDTGYDLQPSIILGRNYIAIKIYTNNINRCVNSVGNEADWLSAQFNLPPPEP